MAKDIIHLSKCPKFLRNSYCVEKIIVPRVSESKILFSISSCFRFQSQMKHSGIIKGNLEKETVELMKLREEILRKSDLEEESYKCKQASNNALVGMIQASWGQVKVFVFCALIIYCVFNHHNSF